MRSFREEWSEQALERLLPEAQSLSGLVGLSIENWVVLQRNKFDLHTDDEPHVAQTLYMEKASGRYLHKIFGRTILDGQLEAPSGLKDLTREIFEHSRICRGFPDGVKGEPEIALALGFLPYPQKAYPNCHRVFKDPHGEATACPSCTQTQQSGDITDFVEAKLMELGDVINDESSKVSPGVKMENSELTLWPNEHKTRTRKRINYSESNRTDEESSSHCDVPRLVSKRRRKNQQSLKADFGDMLLSPAKVISNTASEDKAHLKGVCCDHCKKIFPRELNYRKHRALIRRHERSIPCKECNQPHYSFASLAKHLEENHKGLPNVLEEYRQTPEEIMAMKKGRKCSTCYIYVNGNVMVHRHRALYHELGDFKCEDCDQHLLTYYHLVLHNYNQHDRVTPTLEPSSQDLEKVEHKDGSIELVRNRHACPKCEKSYKCDGLWGIHMKVNHSWSVFACEQCDEMCHYLQDFQAHVNNFHSDKPDIKCPKCAEVFSLKGDPERFESHFQVCVRTLLKKNDETPLQCEKCGKNYSSRYLLQCHLNSHEGVERYLCDKCDYGTNLRSVMNDHQRSHLRTEGKTQDGSGADLFYHCPRCPKKFAKSDTLNRHIKHVHEGVKREFKCDICPTTFTSKSLLYSHKKQEHGFISSRSRRGRRKL